MTSISDTEVVNAPGGLVELAYVQRTSPVFPTATTIPGDSLGLSITVVTDGSPILLDFFTPFARGPVSAGSFIQVALYEDGILKIRDWGGVNTSGANDPATSIHLSYKVTPSVGVHTYTVYSRVSSGTGYIGAGDGVTATQAPAFLRASKILQASQLLVTQSNAPIVTSLPSGNLVTGQEVDLYVTSPYVGYQRYKWNGSAWYMIGDSRGAEWQSFTPGLANITLGNGTLTGRYTVYGKRVNYIGQLNWGSTTSASGYFVVNLPTNAFGSIITGSVQMVDGGTRAWTGSCAPWSAGQFYIVHTESGNFGGVNQSNPFTWGSGDYFSWSLTYEMA